MGLNLNVSHDAGKTFTTLRGMHGDHHGLWIDPGNLVGALQRQRRRILQVRRCREELAVRRVGRRVAVLQRRARHEHTGVGVRLDPGRWQPPRARRHHEGARSHPRGRMVRGARAAKVPTKPSIRSNPNIVYSHGFYGNFTREDLGVSAAPVRGNQQPGRGRGGRPGVTAIRPPQEPGGPELRAQWMAPILVLAARSGNDLRWLSVRPAIDQPWRRVAGDQQGSERERSRRRCCSRARTRFPTRRSSRLRNRRGPRG